MRESAFRRYFLLSTLFVFGIGHCWDAFFLHAQWKRKKDIDKLGYVEVRNWIWPSC